jgi:molybdate transport system substrate-binding protein
MVLRVLSAGAVQRGLEAVAQSFEKETSQKTSLTFATAPVIRGKVEDHEFALDLVIAPLESMREFEQTSLIAAGSSAIVGSVKAGIVVRQGVWQPDISGADALKEELLACDSIVYTQGSSGVFAEELIRRFGISEVVKEKTTRLADAGAVMKFLASGKNPKAIGFGQLTAILLHADKGVKLVGSLPKDIENITTYAAGVTRRAQRPELARHFQSFLTAPFARAAFEASGVDPSLASPIKE